MSAFEVVYSIQVSGSILLVVIESSSKSKRDVILLATPCADALQPSYIERLKQTMVWPDDIEVGENSIDLTIEIEEDLFDRTKRWCSDLGISVKQLVLAFLRFCACMDNRVALKDFFSLSRLMVELTEVTAELRSVQAVLFEIKQHYGVDKQEAFLKSNADITLKEFAAMLHGRDCKPNLSQNELLLAKERGFVVVYGDSDDRVEFEGAIRAEGHTNPFAKDSPAGVLVLSCDGELLDEDSDLYADYVAKNHNVIKVFYCNKDNLNWVFETDITHETFLTYDGGLSEEYADFDEGFARFMVFELSALRKFSKDILPSEDSGVNDGVNENQAKIIALMQEKGLRTYNAGGE